MRRTAWFLVFGVLGLALAGCNSDAPTAEDNQFQKDLAEAASKNTEVNPKKLGSAGSDSTVKREDTSAKPGGTSTGGVSGAD